MIVATSDTNLTEIQVLITNIFTFEYVAVNPIIGKSLSLPISKAGYINKKRIKINYFVVIMIRLHSHKF